MNQKTLFFNTDDIPMELWEKCVALKKELAPNLTMEEWFAWLLKQGLKLYQENKPADF